jgi:hypothetical protein
VSQGGYWLGLLGGIVILVTSVEVVRRRYVRGRFAVIWSFIGVGAILLSLFPGILGWAADVAHVQVPLNLLLFVGVILLLVINMQLSAEVGRLDERTRVLAEQIALLRAQPEPRPAEPPEGASGG